MLTLAALAALSALAAWPVVRAGYPAIGDGLNHYYRLVEFEHLLAQGVWFPRWGTDLGYGYGYPVYNFSPALTLYLGALFHGLGLDNGQSLVGVYVFSWVLAITGAYWLARQRGGPAAALIAAAAYGLAPYLYFDALARGALPESLGLGLLPWVLWATYRLAAHPTRGLFIALAGLYAALVLTHLLTALVALPLIGLVWLMALADGQHSPRSFVTKVQVPLAVLFGCALSAYFLAPALLETKLVFVKLLTEPADLDYHNNFLRLTTLLAWPQTFDARLVFQDVAPSLSLAALGLAAAGLAWRAWHTWRGQRALEAWDAGLWLGLIGLSLLTFPLSGPVWEHLPGASLLQFPWRLVGPASLLLALLAARVAGPEAANAVRAEQRAGARPLRQAGAALALAGLFGFSLTWTFYAGPTPPATAGVRDLAGYERDNGQLGTTSNGEFLPLTVKTLPDPDSLDAAYALYSVIERLGPPPAGVSVESQTATVTSASVLLTAETPAPVTFEIFDFAGWRATVDGQPAAISPSQPNGLITVAVPAGRHTVRVAFEPTPLRTVASAVSFLGAGLLLLIASGRVPVGIPKEDLTPQPPSPMGKGVPSNQDGQWAGWGRSPVILVVSIVALGLLGLRIAAIDGHATLFAQTRFDGERVAGVGQAFDTNFEDQLVLIGLDLPASRMAADGALPVTLYWREQNVPKVDYSTTVQVLDDQGNLWGQSDSQNPGRLPTSRWRPGQYARDVHVLRLRPGTPPGQYRLAVAVYPVGGAALSVLDANRAPQGPTEPLGTLIVTRVQKPPASLDAAQPANVALGPLTYLGGGVSTASPQAGDDLTLELFWRAEGAMRPDMTLHLALIGADGQLIQAWDAPPARPDYPSSQWLAGEVVRSVQRLRVPAQAPGGPASLQLSLLPAGTGPVAIATLNVRVPARSWVVPAMGHVLNTPMGPSARLLGYDLNSDGLTLYWQAEATMDTGYVVFVHALDAAGTIVSQVDAPPLNGSRPTTGWLSGEVLTDRYALALNGARLLEVGLYEPTTRQRLGTVTIPLTP